MKIWIFLKNESRADTLVYFATRSLQNRLFAKNCPFSFISCYMYVWHTIEIIISRALKYCYMSHQMLCNRHTSWLTIPIPTTSTTLHWSPHSNSFDLIFSTNIYVEPYTDKFLISMLVDFFAKTVWFCFKNLAWFHIPKSQAHTMTVLFLTLYLKMVLRRVSIQRRGGAIILKLSDFLYLWVWFQSDVLEKCLWFLSDTEKKPVYLRLCQALYRIF